MFAGVDDKSGKRFDEFSFARELEELLQGREFEMPDDVNGGMMTAILEVHFQGICADLLGAAGVGPWTECFRSQHPCYDCWWHSKCFCAYVPTNATERRRKGTHAPECKCSQPRTEAETLGDMARIDGTTYRSKAARTKDLRVSGISKVRCALHYIPGANLETDTRKDTMHLFLRGITAHEALWMIDRFVKAGEFTWADLNEARKNLKVPRGHKIPELVPPKSDGKKLKAQAICLNGSGVLHFAVNRCVATVLHVCCNRVAALHGAATTRSIAEVSLSVCLPRVPQYCSSRATAEP